MHSRVPATTNVLHGSTTIGIGLLTAADAPAVRTLLNVYSTAQVDTLIASIGGLSVGDIDTLAKLNAIVTDAILIDSGDTRLSDARTPTSHALSHTDGTDDIQSATAGQKGLMTSAYAAKLDAIEAGATGDQTGAEIKALYEAEADTNAFTDAEKTKLAALLTTTTDRIVIFLSSLVSDASAATGVVEFNIPQDISLTSVKFECDSDNPPTGAAAQMDLLLNGVSIFSTNPTIDAGESSSDTATTAPVLANSPTAISAGANLEFDLDQVGVINPGRGYYAVLIFSRSSN